jgi:hypothetical protein
MKLALILLIVALIAFAPVATTVLPTHDVATACEQPEDQESEMTWLDWLILWWTTHPDDLPW